MADKIKGITIEFRGDTTPLQKAIRTVNSDISKTTKELTAVNKALKFNPTNVDLWRQKQELLTQKIEQTREKLSALKQSQQQMDASGVAKNAEEYRRLERQIIETESQLKTFKTQLREVGNVNLKALSEGFKEAGSKIESTGRSLSGVSLAATGVVTGLGAISVKAGRVADDLNTLSKVTGISTGELQKYSYAADLVDVSVEAIAKSNKRLVKSAYSAAKGSKASAEAFEAIGVSVTDANGKLRSSDAIFTDVISALGQMTNETERDAIAQQLMGRSAAELNPLIEDGGETYRRVAETLAKYDLDFIDQETLDKANQFNDELDTMKLIGSVAFAQIGSELAGYLAPALSKVVKLTGRFAKWLSKLDPQVLAVVGGIAAFVAILAPLLIGIGKVAFAISSIINVVNLAGGAFGAVAAVLTGPVGIALAAAVAAIVAVIAIMKVWKNHGNDIKNFFAAFGERIKGIWNGIKTAIATAASSMFDAMTWPYRRAWEFIKDIINRIRNLFPIKIGNFFGHINLPHFSISGKLSLKPPRVPHINVDWYDKGGIFDSPSVIGVGEKRPEFVGALDDLRQIVREESGGGGAPVINIYPTPSQDPAAIAREVEKVLVRWQKQKVAAYGNI